MNDAPKVSKEARLSLLRQEVFRDAAPEYGERRDTQGLALALASTASKSDPLGTIEAFVNCTYEGITPPAFVLILIAENLKAYLHGKGAHSLDEAFNLAPKQRIGHPIKARIRSAQRGRITYLMWQLRKAAEAKGEILSIEAAAGRVINALSLSESEDVLKKHYIASKTEKIFDGAARIIKETLEEQTRRRGK